MQNDNAADYLTEAREALDRASHPAELQAARYALAEAMALQVVAELDDGSH